MKFKYIAAIIAALSLPSCLEDEDPISSSGVSKKTVEVKTDADGWTTEQKNIAERLKRDNEAGAIKHLYVISPYSGQVILYSTVKGKVTSSGKRLTPTSVRTRYTGNQGPSFVSDGMPVFIGDTKYSTSEVIQDDGTYGSSCEYIYWFDQKNAYHSHYFTGGQIIHISDQPMPVTNITINLEKQ